MTSAAKGDVAAAARVAAASWAAVTDVPEVFAWAAVEAATASSRVALAIAARASRERWRRRHIRRRSFASRSCGRRHVRAGSLRGLVGAKVQLQGSFDGLRPSVDKTLEGALSESPELVRRGSSGTSRPHEAAECGVQHHEIFTDLSRSSTDYDSLDATVRLRSAVRRGDILVTASLLKETSGGMLCSVSPEGDTLLHIAVCQAHAEVARCLLDSPRFTEANSVDRSGLTALHCAALAGHAVIADILLGDARFLELNAQEPAYLFTALHLAAFAGHADVASLCFEHQRFTAVDARDLNGCTAFHAAAHSGHAQVVRTLFGLANRAFLSARGRDEDVALHSAAYRGHLECVALLLDRSPPQDVNAQGNEGMTALHYAVGSRQIREKSPRDVAASLLQHPCFRPSIATGRSVAEHYTVDAGRRLDIVECILHHPRFVGFDLVAKTGFTVLHLACWEGFSDMVGVILACLRFTSLAALDRMGHNVLHLAALKGHVAVAGLLMEEERFGYADVRTHHGYTALHYAAQRAHVGIVGLLLSYRHRFTRVNAKDDATGATALHEACSGGHAEIASMLLGDPRCTLQANKQGRTALHEAAIRGHTSIVAVFMSRPDFVWRSGPSGMTSLHYAAQRGHVEVVRLLASQIKGGNSCVSPEELRAATNLARSRGHDEICALLEEVARVMLVEDVRQQAQHNSRAADD